MKKTFLDKFKELKEVFTLFSSKGYTQEEVVVKLGSVEVTDQTGASAVLEYTGESLAVGTPLFIMVDGEAVPCPEGVYTTEDGGSIRVGVDEAGNPGVLLEIMQPASTGDNGNAAPAAQAPVAQPEMSEQAVKSIVESIVKETYFSKEEVNAKIQELNDKLAALEKDNKELKEKNIELSKQPSTTATVDTTPSVFSYLKQRTN